MADRSADELGANELSADVPRLVVRGAREHNLRGVDLDLPRDSIIVFTGLSGSGKSSLAFDTIFAEGQRRYVESLCAYARQFLGQMDKPDVDFIEGLSPAVSIDQKSTNRNPRSTVGTITEVYDYLRLLYARAGIPHCPVCGHVIERQTPQQIVDQVLAMAEGSRFQVLAPVVRTRKGEFVDLFSDAAGPGLLAGAGRRHGAPADRPAEAEEAGEARHRGGGRPAGREGIGQAAAHRLGRDRAAAGRRPGRARLRRPRPGRPAPRAALLRADGLPERPPAEPRRPRAAHVLLQLALRRLPGVQRHRDQEGGRPGAGGARRRRPAWPTGPSRPWAGGQTSEYFGRLLEGLANQVGFRMDTPWRKLPAAAQKAVLHGSDEQVHVRYRNRYGRERSYYANYEGVIPFLERRLDADRLRLRSARSTRGTCATCPARSARARGSSRRCWPSPSPTATRANAPSPRCRPCRWPSARSSSDGMLLDARQTMIAGRVLKEVQARLGFLLDVGLHYLSLDRAAGSLSGGEAQRIRLATQIGSGSGRGAVRARRAVHRAAPARQPPAHPDPGPAARPGQHADRGRARRGHHPGRRLGGRHRAGRGRARRPHRAQRPGRRARGARHLPDRRLPVRPALDPGARHAGAGSTRSGS